VKRSNRGMTLLEMMIAVGLTSLVMSLALSLVVTGMTIARKDEQVVASNMAARTATEALLRDLRLSGVPAGIYVTDPGGTPFRINSIFSVAGAGGVNEGLAGTDELWVVSPRPQMMRSDCALDGSAAVITSNGTGTLSISCKTPIENADLLLVTNFQTAALITPTAFPTSTTMNYAEQGVSGFTNAPEKGVFMRGDYVVPVDIVHYYIEANPVTNRPQLVRAVGGLAATPTAAAPFADDGTRKQVFANVEDLQLAFGVGVAPAITFSSAINGAAFDPAAAPVSLRVSVVGITPLRVVTEDGNILPLGPVTVEDHVAAVVPDGFRRSVVRRRVELLNIGAVSL
jgi:prepilin-type N-terminal cleavage/methylation domain-containing protein